MSAPASLTEFVITCIGGLEEVAVEEMRVRLGSAASAVRPERGAVGRVFFRYRASPRRLLELRCPTRLQAIAAQAHDVTVGGPGLERVLRCLRQLPLESVQRIARACDPGVDGRRFHLEVSLRGNHRFETGELRAGAEALLRSELGLQPGTGSGSPMRLSLQVRRRRALVSVQLGPGRPGGDPRREGWPGPAASSVARLLDLDDRDLLVAVPHKGRAGAWVGRGDGSGLALGADGRRLPVADETAAAALVVPRAGADGLEEQMAEPSRVVAPGGVVAMLAPPGPELGTRLRRSGLPLEALASLPYHVNRKKWGLFLLERLEGGGPGLQERPEDVRP